MAKNIHYNASIQVLIKHPHVIHCLVHFELVVNCLLPLFHNMMDKVLSTKEYYSKSRPYKLHQLLNKNLVACWLPPLHCFTFHSISISRSLSLPLYVCMCILSCLSVYPSAFVISPTDMKISPHHHRFSSAKSLKKTIMMRIALIKGMRQAMAWYGVNYIQSLKIFFTC